MTEIPTFIIKLAGITEEDVQNRELLGSKIHKWQTLSRREDQGIRPEQLGPTKGRKSAAGERGKYEHKRRRTNASNNFARS